MHQNVSHTARKLVRIFEGGLVAHRRPDEDRARLGVGVQDIAARRATDGFRTLLALEVTRARDMFATTAALEDVLDPAIRPGVRLARSVYERVLDRVEALDFDVLRHRVRVPPWELGAVAVAAFRPLAGVNNIPMASSRADD